MTSVIPVTIIGGYLGAGKTTLINHVLRQARGIRLAVLVNDFGSLPIDASLIESRTADVISLAGGCICCSFGSDLMSALAGLSQRIPIPDRVLIETSGVAMPGSVARSAALLSTFSVNNVVVIVDAGSIVEQAADRYVGSTIERQLREADLLVLNKIDLVAAPALESLRAWMAVAAPRAPQLETSQAAISLDALFAGRPDLPSRDAEEANDANACFESEALVPDGPVDVAAFASALVACDVVRAKGVLLDIDGTPKVLQVAGGRAAVTTLARADGAAVGVVCIGIRGSLPRARLREALSRATGRARLACVEKTYDR